MKSEGAIGLKRMCMAEREGFEPPERINAQLISSQPHSTTLAPLRILLLDPGDVAHRSSTDLIRSRFGAFSPLRGALRASIFLSESCRVSPIRPLWHLSLSCY